MRDLKECEAEVFRRSETRIRQRKQRRKRMAIASVPLVLCIVLSTIFWSSNSGNTASGEAQKPEGSWIPNYGYSGMGTVDGYIKESEQEPAAAAIVDVQYIRTDGGVDNGRFPAAVVIHSYEELRSYYYQNKDNFDLERKESAYADTTIGFLDACDRYPISFFTGYDLLLVLLEEGSGSARHNVTVSNNAIVDIQTVLPDVGTCDMAQWHIMVTLPKGDNPQIYWNGKLLEVGA